MSADEGERWGFFNAISDDVIRAAHEAAARIVSGPTFANGITKTQLHQQWSMSVDQAIECEAQAQALCMQTGDFTRAYDAFVAREKPVFEGN
jgi:enoyl-CoA hydratase/carnithine racemase